nr:UPF0182 family protein [Arsenicicoccus piscis]
MAIIALVAVLLTMGASVWTRVLWFQSLGYTSVFTTQLTTQALLFVVGGLVTALLVASSLAIGFRTRPIYAPSTPEQDALDRYRAMFDPLRRLGVWLVPAVLGAFAGTAMASQWKTFLLWRNGGDFGTKDPAFGMDVGFFVFRLPWWEFFVDYVLMSLALATIVAALTHYVYGGLRLGGSAGGTRTTRAAIVHLSVLCAGLALVQAISYWLSRYSLSVQSSTKITGMTYTDAHAVLPSRSILAVAAVICALFFLATIRTGSWRLPIVGVSLLAVLALVVGTLYPAIVQSVQARPNQYSLETEYVDRNIKSTRAAFAIDKVIKSDYTATTTATPGQLRQDAETVPGIRIMDPSVVSTTFKQQQAIRGYYDFAPSLDVDRYTLDGKTQDTIVGVRELSLPASAQGTRNWVSDHTVYTHGYGVVAAYGNRKGPDGQPVYFETGTTPGPLKVTQPRVYFGELSTPYSIVGGPPGGTQRELDYGDTTSTYEGSGGVSIGSFARRLAYAVTYRDPNIVLSDTITDQSRLLDVREPRERVQAVAPWLTLDGNPYPTVVNGRIQWVVDGYTTSDHYPYSQLTQIGDATADSLTERPSSNVAALGAEQVNYMRNSVKATVDAYDGHVTLYAWDDTDPVLKAWSSAFGNTVEPLSAISGELMSHLRYPEDLFKVQRQLLASYHVTDPSTFLYESQKWKVPSDPTGSTTATPASGATTASPAATDSGDAQPPYYQSIAMPGTGSPTFSLTTSFIPNNRTRLSGYLSADSDAGATAGKRRAGYGILRLLQVDNDAVDGPGQVANKIKSSSDNSAAFSLTLSQWLNNGGSNLTMGNLLTLPVGGGFLYVQPLYLRGAAGGTSFPQVKAIVTVFGDKIAWSDSLDGALDALFAGSAGASSDDKASPPSGTPSGPVTGEVARQLRLAQQAMNDGQKALAKGDFAAYGQAQTRLKAALEAAVKAQQAPAPTGSPTPTPAATATPTPTPAATATPTPAATGTPTPTGTP